MAQNYVLLERIELNANAASVTFSNIPQTGYTDLKLVWSARGTGSLVYDTTKITFNGNASSYSTRYIQGSGSAASSGVSGASTYLEIIDEGGNTTASTFGNSEIYIPNYTAAVNKSVSSDAVTETNATTVYMRMSAGLWSNTAAITSITLTPDASAAYASGSTFSLYGIAKLGTTPAIAPKASGGNIIATDGTYWYHAFLSSGTFTPQTSLSCDYLVVAGGGGGGTNGGGGGAGGLRGLSAQTLTTTDYTVTIGAGGAVATNGANSSFGSTSATGGGKGATNAVAGGNGGSGGGGSSDTAANGSHNWTRANGTGNAGGYSPVEGYAGGNYTYPNAPSQSNSISGGGGGGAGGAGAAAGGGTGNASGGAGGVGSSAYSAWGLATNTGQNVSGTVYFAGGGGGMAGYGFSNYGYGTVGAGGYGGGGAGGREGNTASVNGTANTGGGGGGYDTGSNGAGGSGIVIIRYAV